MGITIDTLGAHPTTESCLELLQWLEGSYDFTRILDMGCGNGILSVTAAMIWDAPVLAVDISERALADAAENIAANELSERVSLLRSDGFAERNIAAGGPYDLIIINLLAQQLIAMAPQVQKNLAPGGICLISGMLAWLTADVEAAFSCLGFEILKKTEKESWHSLVLRYRPATEG